MRVSVLLWIVFLVLLSLAPLGIKDRLHTTGHFHLFGHFCIFVLTGILFSRGVPAAWAKVLRFLIVVLMAAALEWLETAIYHNKFEWTDLKVDAFGAAIGFLLVILASILFSSFNRKTVSAAE